MDYPKIEIRNKAGKGILTGANAEILINGEVLKYVTEVSLVIKAREVPYVVVKMMGDIHVSVVGELETKVVQLKTKD